MIGRPVHVSDLRSLPLEKVWKLRGRYAVTFDDGIVLEVASRQIKLSWPYWALSRFYPQVPTPSTLCYRHGQVSTDDNHIEFMSRASTLARNAGVDLADTRYILSQHMYADSFNSTVKYLLPYCSTVDIDTMWDIYKHPNFDTIRKWAEDFPTGYDPEGVDMVEEAYKLIEDILFNDESLRYNPVVMSIKDGTVKLNSILQAYVRGKTSEIDSRVYTNQVWEGLFTGLHQTLSRLKEAGATSRSHLYNTDNIAAAEYTSRKFQLAANVLMTFTIGDCGTRHYHHHTFTDIKTQKELYNSMVGLRYRLENDTGLKWQRFNKGEFENFVGKPLIFRTAMCCEHLTRQGVCSMCMGDLAYNMSSETAPGQLASTAISEKGSQGILSTKHLDFLRFLLNLVITPTIRHYMEEYKHNSLKGLCFKQKPLVGDWNDYELVIQDKMYSELSQIAYHESVDDVDETALPEVNDLTFQRRDAEGELLFEESVDVRMGVCGNFSKPFLHFFLKNRDNLRFVKKVVHIPMKGWNTKHPVLVYTNRSESMAEFVSVLETKIRSVASDKGESILDLNNVEGGVKMNKTGQVKTRTLVEMTGSTEEQCTFALFDTFRYINRKLKGIPLTHIGIMLAISRVQSPTDSFPAVGFDNEEANDVSGKRFVDHNTLIGVRSAAPMLLFEGQQDNINNVGFYVIRKKPASLYDGAFFTLPM